MVKVAEQQFGRMTQATSTQFEELGAIKDNVRHNEKTIDEIKVELKDIRGDIKEIRSDIRSFQLQFYAGVLVILVAQTILKFLV